MRPLPACLLLAALTPAFGQTTASSGTGPATAPNAVRLTKFILGVADLDKSYAFYHALGLDLENGSTALSQPNPLADALLKLVDVPPGTKFRNMMLKVPGADFSLEVTEFSNLELHIGRPRMQDPGASLFVLTVRDLVTALAAAKKVGGEVLTTSGSPVSGRLIVRDPDGYYVEFQLADPQLQTTAPATSMVTGARFGSVVQDAESAARFYRDRFGFEIKTSAWSATPNAQMRTADAVIPGTNLVWQFTEFKDIDRKPYRLRIPDPGAPALGLQVRDLDAATAAVKAAGGSVVTQGGSAGLGGGKVAFVRDPSGVLVELAQPAPRK
jgi:catechol 2,3-dioxygenase-like lactoylglutathione lyase family enzyme